MRRGMRDSTGEHRPTSGATTHAVVEFDELLGPDGAAAMVELCARFGRYGMYSQEHVESDIGKGLSQRHDAASNFVRTGGRYARNEPKAVLAARTNYFREEYAYGQRPLIDGIEPYLFHEGFAEAARTVHGRPVIEPAIVFANLMVPGQELAVHTDVPEFRGCNRKVMPQWLLVAMHHSGLFDEWRMPIATGVAWFHDCDGGEFCYYPGGAAEAVGGQAGAVRHGLAVRRRQRVPRCRSHRRRRRRRRDRAVAAGDDARSHRRRPLGRARHGRNRTRRRRVRLGRPAVQRVVEGLLLRGRTRTAHVARARRRPHARLVVDRLVEDLRARGRIEGDVPGNPDLGLLIIDEYIKFPVPAAG